LIKILVVDDEVLERRALSKMIHQSSVDVTVIGEAANGRLAIEMAKKHRPDIIFMDIKMPGVDGVEAVKEIKKFAPEIRFIMVSAFNTFEYAKEVMQQGVKEYILKPSKKEDILASLERVAAEICEERLQKEEHENLRESLNKAVSIAQKEWVSSLLLNQVQDITFDAWGELLGVEITSGFIMLFYLEANDGELTQAVKQTWYTWLKDTLKSEVETHEIFVGPMTESQVPVLFLCKKTDEKILFKANAQMIIESILRKFQLNSFQGALKVSVGLPYNEAAELNQSYHDAVGSMQMLLKNPTRKYSISDKLSTTEMPVVSNLLEIEKKLLEAVRQGDVNQVLYIFDSFVARNAADENLKTAAKAFDELFVLITRMLHDLGVSYQQTPVLNEAEDDTRMIEKAKSYLISVVTHVQVWRNDHAKSMLHKAKEFIEANYADSITLETVAEYVELSPFYFSKLFKDRFGMTFIDYLTEIRINHAKTEMENPAKSLKEICYSVGYRDPNYFSRVFKKQTGLSPTEYRKGIVS
jgi:two-component system response regulator YesN